MKEQQTYTPREMIDRLVAFDTTSARSNLDLIDFVSDYLQSYGVESKLFMNEEKTKANLFATVGPDTEGGVVLSGHTDVVPVQGQDWATDPFTVTEKDQKLFGRGTADMKSFSALALSLVPEMLAAKMQRPIHFALSYDEEVGCIGVVNMVTWIAKLDQKPAMVIVGEPTSMRVINAHKGIRCFETTITGLEAHSSRQHEGVSAIIYAGKLIAFLSDLIEELKDKGDPTGRFEPPYTTIQIGQITGGTAINIIPGSCSFTWEHRNLPTQDADEIRDRFYAFAARLEKEMKNKSAACSISTREFANAPGLMIEEENAAEALALSILGKNQTEAVAYGTEAGYFQGIGIPTVVCGPGDIAQAHIADEFIEVSQITACEDFLRKVIAAQAK